MKRDRALTFVLLGVGAVALWVSSRMTWLQVTSEDGLGEPKVTDIIGSTYFPVLTPVALLLVALIGLLALLRGWVVRLLGIALALGAAALAVPAYVVLIKSVTTARAAQLAELPARAEVVELEQLAGAAIVALTAAICVFAAGLALTRRAPEQSAADVDKFAAPAVRRAEARSAGRDDGGAVGSGELSERAIWDALDSGVDPTAGSSDEPADAAETREF